ncbi:MAG TPA: hypothetical protein VJS91_11020 [Nitrososphaeraceae archaeon]|nr:hypothetical protein [Nitrososphaeraceae archaeon]
MSKSKRIVSRTSLIDSLKRKFCIITYEDGSKETIFTDSGNIK